MLQRLLCNSSCLHSAVASAVSHDLLGTQEQLVCDAECQIEVRPEDSDGDFPKIKSHMYAFKNYICFTNQESDWAGGASDLAGRTKTWTLKLSNVSVLMLSVLNAIYQLCLLGVSSLNVFQVTNVEKKSVALVVGNAIRICGGKQQFFISGIKDRDEVSSLVCHLMPPIVRFPAVYCSNPT